MELDDHRGIVVETLCAGRKQAAVGIEAVTRREDRVGGLRRKVGITLRVSLR